MTPQLHHRAAGDQPWVTKDEGLQAMAGQTLPALEGQNCMHHWEQKTPPKLASISPTTGPGLQGHTPHPLRGQRDRKVTFWPQSPYQDHEAHWPFICCLGSIKYHTFLEDKCHVLLFLCTPQCIIYYQIFSMCSPNIIDDKECKYWKHQGVGLSNLFWIHLALCLVTMVQK